MSKTVRISIGNKSVEANVEDVKLMLVDENGDERNLLAEREQPINPHEFDDVRRIVKDNRERNAATIL